VGAFSEVDAVLGGATGSLVGGDAGVLKSSALGAALLLAGVAADLGAGATRAILGLGEVTLATFDDGVGGSGANAIWGVGALAFVSLGSTGSAAGLALVFRAAGSGEDTVRSSTIAPPITVTVITPSATPKWSMDSSCQGVSMLESEATPQLRGSGKNRTIPTAFGRASVRASAS
jgi:hypothetical protein